MLDSTTDETITNQFLSLLWFFVNEKINSEDEEIWLKNRSCKQLTRKFSSSYRQPFQGFLILHDLQFRPQNEQFYNLNYILSL